MGGGNRGFTIIELMVTVAVIIVLMLIAQPSFEGLRQRAALRGAGEHLISFWNQARLEAAKRNSMIKVGVVQSSGGSTFCLGAATTTDPTDTVPCDCTSASPSSDVCDIARFPGDQSEWRSVTLSGITLGGNGRARIPLYASRICASTSAAWISPTITKNVLFGAYFSR